MMLDPGFGRVFTDHMVHIRWAKSTGWGESALLPYGPLALDPCSQVFHYGQQVFEGLKAYRQADGRTCLFRPDANARRFERSCLRMAMPPLPPSRFIAALKQLVEADRDWVPDRPGHSLYLRPFMIATQQGLGLHGPSDSYLFVVIASPAAGYFTRGLEPVAVAASTSHVRAYPGGTGEAKCGGNYAGALAEQVRAAEEGYDQVLWLDAAEHRYVEEMGTSNVFFVYGSTLVTPPLSGTLMPGVNRDSLLMLAGDLGLDVREERVSLASCREDARNGRLTEAFASGTAALVAPVGRVKEADDTEWLIGDGTAGPVTRRLRDELDGIQRGLREDRRGWIHHLS
jgi:branched-chain amino acid aminotransferase